MEFNERELYLILHAVDEAARRARDRCSDHDIVPQGRERELWALVDKFSKAGACFVYPTPDSGSKT